MKKYKKGGKKFPDLTGDGKVTFADVLKGRGVKKAKYGMKYEGGGKAPEKMKKKGPSTSKIENNKANLEARKLMASSMPGSANVGKNPYEGRAAGAQRRGPMDLKPSGYKPQPKPAPKPMNKKKGYVRVWDAKAGKYVNKLKNK